MRVGLINPNTSVDITAKMVASASAVFPEVDIVGLTAASGPAEIETYADEVVASVEVVKVLKANPGLDAYVIACAGDPALFAARESVTQPVVGIGEAGFHMACLLGAKFGVVTTQARGIGDVWAKLAAYGLADRCADVVAAGVGAIATSAGGGGAMGSTEQAARQLLDQTAAEVVVLGCGGMSDYAAEMSARLGAPVVDGVSAAMGLVTSLVRAGLTTSKVRSFAPAD